jgi:asparagine synthase (glutamine-hydrolysing)
LYDKLSKLFPTKFQQVNNLFKAIYYCERNEQIYEYVYTHPLLSQPIVELALKIPTYQSYADGFDRIFLRKAVSRIKNPKSIWRKVKGQTTGSTIRDCAEQAEEITNFITNGSLYKSGIINKKWVQNNLIAMRHRQNNNLWPILHILSSQMFLSKWKL